MNLSRIMKPTHDQNQNSVNLRTSFQCQPPTTLGLILSRYRPDKQSPSQTSPLPADNNNKLQSTIIPAHIDPSSQLYLTSILKDNPKPAVFLARKLFCDFVHLSGFKIESILAQEINKNKPIFKPLTKGEDPIYDRVLDAIGSISEFCLPSLLKTLVCWYHHQLGDEENSSKKLDNSQFHSLQQVVGEVHHQSSLEYGSPVGQSSSFLASDSQPTMNTLSIRSPTPSSPDATSNQISITSTLPLDYQSPSLTIFSEHHSSAANTSTSTATNVSSNSLTEDSSKNAVKHLETVRTRKLLIEYAFCRALIEIFGQLQLHPGHESLIAEIEDIAFEHFKYVDTNSELSSNDVVNINQLIDKYAEVIGVLAQYRFKTVRKRFMAELNELRNQEPTPHNIQSIVSLLASMRYFRIKMAPIEEFEASFQFLQECAEYFLEVRHKSIKHALAGLFVEIMVPLSVIVKNEVKIPCLKNFVDMLWAQTLEMSTRKKHSLVMYPLVTCLLCASQRSFFLACWSGFLNMCLSNLKNRDQKMCRVALESLYRLIWIYMIRIKCESNNITQNRLQSIVDAIFPRGNRTVTPRDAPLSIFVDIIHFIAQERLDFAMRHIIFDLLSVDRPQKVIVAPERMNIAIQAFIVIADSLQQKEGEPTMSEVLGLPRPRRTHINKMLTLDIAKQIGISQYFLHVQRSFNDILKSLDSQLGRPLSLTINLNFNKEPEGMITGDRKPKIDLFKTCIAAIPRLMPDGMSRTELIDLLSRMTVHVDEEMRKLAFESLQILITEFPDWRLDCIEGFTLFLANQIDESMRVLVDKALAMLLQLLISWHRAITYSQTTTSNNPIEQPRSTSVTIHTGYETISSRNSTTGGQIAARKNRALAEMRLIQSELSNTRFERLVSVIQRVEGASLVMSCSCHQPTRRLASHLMRECRAIVKCYTSWICMEQFGLKSPEEVEEEDLSASLRGSLSADNLSRITTTSANGPAHSSATSINTQAILSTSVSRMCIGATNQQQALQSHSNQTGQGQNQHDPYDSDLENHLAECLSNSDQNSTLIFWIAVIMLESDHDQEYLLALRLLKKILPNLPFEQADFVEDIEQSLLQMRWQNFPGIHALVLRGCISSATYDISINLLDSLTPILKYPICTGFQKNDSYFPAHVVALTTHLLANYDDPTPLSLNIARRIAIWCDESALKGLENLATVMNLYSRRSFSKDGFQWTKCVIKYLNDVYKDTLPQVIPLLVDMLQHGPQQVQRLVAPILYCILSYVDTNTNSAWADLDLIQEILRVYSKYLNDLALEQWRDAVQIFKLLISRSSHLSTQSGSRTRELPGRTMDFSLFVESLLIIAKPARDSAPVSSSSALQQAAEQLSSQSPVGGLGGDTATVVPAGGRVATPMDSAGLESLTPQQAADTAAHTSNGSPDIRETRQAGSKEEVLVGDRCRASELGATEESQEAATTKWRRSWLAHGQIRERLVSLLLS